MICWYLRIVSSFIVPSAPVVLSDYMGNYVPITTALEG